MGINKPPLPSRKLPPRNAPQPGGGVITPKPEISPIPGLQQHTMGLFGEPPVVEEQGFRSIYVHFECLDDMMEFRRLTGLDVNPETKVIWYPEGCVGK